MHTLTAAVDHNTDAGFLPFAAAAARELAATLHLNRPGDRESAAHHSADAAALTMRINSEVGTRHAPVARDAGKAPPVFRDGRIARLSPTPPNRSMRPAGVAARVIRGTGRA